MSWEEYKKTEEAFIKQLEKNGDSELAAKLRENLEALEKNHQEVSGLESQIMDLKNQVGEEKWNELVSSIDIDDEEVKKIAEKYIIK